MRNVDNNVSKKIKKLKSEIKDWDDILEETDDKTADMYYAKARKLDALWELTKLDEDYKQAIESYNKAIDIDGEKPSYYVDRSKLYAANGEPQLAIKDLTIIQELKDRNIVATGIDALYITNTTKDIVKLNKIKDTIKNLKDINPELANALSDLTDLTAEHSVVLGAHGEQLVDHGKRIIQLELMVQQLQSGKDETVKSCLEQIESMKQNMLDQRKELLQVHHTQQKQQEALNYYSGGIDVADIKAQLDKFEQEDIKLFTYYTIFFWTLSNYFQSYRVASTGVVNVNNNFDATQQSTVVESITKKVIALGTKLPIIGSFIELLDKSVDSIFDYIHEYKFNNKQNAINNITKNFTSELQISAHISKAAVDIINSKKKYIINSQIKQKSKLEEISKWLGDKIDTAKSKLIEEKVLTFGENEDHVLNMVFTDISLLLAYLYKNSEKINGKEPLHQQLRTVVLNNHDQAEELFHKVHQNDKQPNTIKTNQVLMINSEEELSNKKPIQKDKCCIIYSLHHIQYDNPSIVAELLGQYSINDHLFDNDDYII